MSKIQKIRLYFLNYLIIDVHKILIHSYNINPIYQKKSEQNSEMSIACQKCNEQPRCPLWCQNCQQVCCPNCFDSHSSHENKIQFICQQCQQVPQTSKTVFCQSCQQHLCAQCSQKIHNKGKRAKHVLHNTSSGTLKIKRLYIACQDVLGYYGYINYGSLLMDLGDNVPLNQTFLLMLEKQRDVDDIKSKLPVIIRSFNSQKDFGDDFCQNSKALYPFLQEIIFIESHRSCKLYDIVKQTKSIKTTLHRLAEVVQKPVHSIANISMSSISLQNNSLNNKSNISAKYPRQIRNHLSSVNISSSTQNSLRKRKRKSPILYYHPFACMKGDKRSGIQNYYRDLAAKGTLMIRKQQCKHFQQGVLRAFYRNIGQTQVQYVSLLLDTISIECLYWVIRSIQEDSMAPTQKLILSRLKQSFDIKVQSKLWNYIIKYLSSSQYQNDRLQVDPMGNIPRLIVKPFNSQDSYILYCKSDNFTPAEWIYQDLGKLKENQEEWLQFIELIDDYFQNNSQIGGGRYGCVQYIKFNAKKPLKQCSLGKLSMFVQEAINKGIIRYHKTLLVSNRQNDQSQHSEARTDTKHNIAILQKSVKIQTLQILLFQHFKEQRESCPISLAQIPQNLRKSAAFDINYVELGFPKLKNFLSSLSNVLLLQVSKSHIMYHMRPQTQTLIQQKYEKLRADTKQLISQIIKQLMEIIDNSKLAGLALQELYHQFNLKIGTFIQFGVFNTTDLYNFLIYYGQGIFDIQMQMGCFIVLKKWQQPLKNSQTSTPTFKQSQHSLKLNNFASKLWGESNWLDQGNKNFSINDKQAQQQQQQNQSQSFSDYQSIYNLIDDDSESKSYPKTVIIKQGSINYGNSGLLYESKFNPIQQSSQNSTGQNKNQDDELFKTKANNKVQHTRIYSNNIQQRAQHNRVYSNMSRD